MEKFLTVEEAALALQVNTDTVRRWLRQGELKGRKLGRIWRIAQSDLASVGKAETARAHYQVGSQNQ